MLTGLLVVDPPYVYRPPSYPNNTVGSYAPAPRPIGVFGSPFGEHRISLSNSRLNKFLRPSYFKPSNGLSRNF